MKNRIHEIFKKDYIIANWKYDTIQLNYVKNETRMFSGDKMKVICKKCNKIWNPSVENVLLLELICYNCHKKSNSSIDEKKIIKYIKDNYILDTWFREHHKIYDEENKLGLPYYSCDGYSRKVYEYKDGRIEAGGRGKGTVFEVLGDYFHSNPKFYNSDISPREGRTDKENYEFTMKRLKRIEECGYKVFYIWISDFRRYIDDLKKNNVHLFDYMVSI